MARTTTISRLLFALSLLTISVSIRAQQPSLEAVNLGPTVNSADDDYGAVLTSTGDTLIFTSSRIVNGKLRKGLNSEILQVSSGHVKHCEMRNWGLLHVFDTMSLRSFSRNLNQGSLAISHDRKFAIFAAERLLAKGGQSAFQDLYQVALDATGRPTGTPHSLTEVNDPDSWDSQPAISSDGQWLFFASDRKFGSRVAGNIDLYYAHRTSSGSWSSPKNAGSTINTEDRDISPFVKGDTLYFASDGNPDGGNPGEGQGMKDIFRSRFTANGDALTFEKPVRLPPPYNSPQNDEFPFITDNNELFLFASDRPGGEGGLDLYSVCRYVPPPPPTITLRGQVTQRPEEDKDERNAIPLPTTIHLRDEMTGDVKSFTTDPSGKFSANLARDHRYSVNTDSLPCFHSPATQFAYSPLPFADTTLTANFEYLSIRERIGLRTDTVVPFFVTGYWYPNSPRNYDSLVKRDSDFVSHEVHYIHRVWENPVEHEKSGDSINYEVTRHEVGRLLEQSIYKPIEDMLRKMFQTSCNDSGLALCISVTGFTDERELKLGPYRDEAVVVDGVNIDTTMQMNQDGFRASLGNRFLSKLRAYFTVKTIDRDLLEESADYRRMKGEHRVVFSAHGEDVDEAGKAQAFKRRVDIQVALVRPTEAQQMRSKYPFVNQRLRGQ